MAWRPNEYLLEGELDNTVPGKVTGWMRFAGMTNKVTFDLQGNFHRDIRGAKLHFLGAGREDDPQAAGYMDSFAEQQTGKTGDITTGVAPSDYRTGYPYIEWYSDQNGRVVLELEPYQAEVIGTPIPACESDPVSRQEQQQNMAAFLAGLSAKMHVPAVLVGSRHTLVSDPAFTHWVVEQDQIIGEAHSVEPESDGICFAFVRLFAMPEMAEYGSIEADKLQRKDQEGKRP